MAVTEASVNQALKNRDRAPTTQMDPQVTPQENWNVIGMDKRTEQDSTQDSTQEKAARALAALAAPSSRGNTNGARIRRYENPSAAERVADTAREPKASPKPDLPAMQIPKDWPEDLRLQDVIGKMARVNLRDVVRILRALEVAYRYIDEDIAERLSGDLRASALNNGYPAFLHARPELPSSEACEKFFAEIMGDDPGMESLYGAIFDLHSDQFFEKNMCDFVKSKTRKVKATS